MTNGILMLPVQVLMGVVACRMVMVETVDDEGKPTGEKPKTGPVLLPALGLIVRRRRPALPPCLPPCLPAFSCLFAPACARR